MISSIDFRNRCVRSTCRITMAHTMKRLFERLGVGSFDIYYNRRLLCWAGYVARMSMDRMPRKLLTCWVEHSRPVGFPKMNWGRTLNKALKSYDLPTNFGQWKYLPQIVWLGSSGSAFGPPARVQQRL